MIHRSRSGHYMGKWYDMSVISSTFLFPLELCSPTSLGCIIMHDIHDIPRANTSQHETHLV